MNNPALDFDVHDTQSESTLVLGSGSTVISAFNNTRLSNNHSVGFARSVNSGGSWTDGGALPNSQKGDSFDPVLARDNVTGMVYLSSLPFFPNDAVQVFRSTDNGSTWSAPVNGAPGFAAGDFIDKPWTTVDNASGPGQGNVYLVFTHVAGSGPAPRPHGLYLTKSVDQGLTWGPSGGMLLAGGDPNSALGGWVMVDPQTHAVYVLWYDRSQIPARIRMVTSQDFGVSFGSAVTVATLTGPAIGGGDLGLNGGLASNSFPQAVVNNANRHLYVIYNDETTATEIKILHQFLGGAGGASPTSLIVASEQPDPARPPVQVFYGTTYGGGAFDRGTVFKMTPDGSVTILHSFTTSEGGYPSGLILANDGNFYGFKSGGVHCFLDLPNLDCGSIFRMTPAGIVTTMHAFAGGSDGALFFSQSALFQATDGNLYGTTSAGGIPGGGTVFRMTLTGTLTILYAFTGGTDGAQPLSGVIQGADGNFYGTTLVGGDGVGCVGGDSCGTVFKMTPAGNVTILHRFAGGPDGAYPYGLIQSAGGDLYGLTRGGGPGGYSPTAYKITTAGVLTALHAFSPAEGTSPQGPLVEGKDGKFYGTTPFGGAYDEGTVFRMTPAGDVTVLHSLNFFAGLSLTQGADGNLYGWGIGTAGSENGVVYRVSADSDIFFTTSTDNGASWSPPAVLNDDPTNRDQFMPTIAVTPGGSQVFAAWYDRRGDPNNSDIERWGVIGNVVGSAVNWGPNFRISGGSFPVVIDQDSFVNQTYMGDYDQAVADNNFFYTTWSDNRWSNGVHLHQPDVRFTKIPVACPVITLGPSNIGNGVIGVSYNETLTQSGGAGPVTFTITGGALPPGLNLSSAGIVSGFPTAAGSFSFTVTATDSNGCAGSRTYSMRVTAVACSKSALSFSVRRPAASMASFADDPLVPGVTIKAVHITELHARIDAIRIRLALPPFGLINAMVVAGDTVRAQHIQQLRTAIVEAYQAACLTPPVFTDSIITGGQTPIRAVHVTELRSAVVALELTLPAQ